MGLSKSQHAYHFRPIVQRAWEAHCAVAGNPHVGDKIAREEWYREQLHACLGVWTTKQCNPVRDFERLMAHFEGIASDGIKWQLKSEGGDARRLAHKIRGICKDHDLDEDYVCRVARQALRLDSLPDLDRMNTEQLFMILRALRCDAERLTVAAHASDPNNEPF